MTGVEREIEIDRLAVGYGPCTVLENINLRFAPGRITGLIGPNGAGKSTLLKSLLGLIEPGAGEIRVDGTPLNNITIAERSRKLAYAAQGAPVHWPLTVEKMVALGRLPHLGPWQKIGSADREAIERAMTMTDSYRLRDRIVTTLSGGERACAMLARTIATDASWLLVDEPVASLDPSHQLQVMGILKNLAGQGHGIVIVLHDLTLARRYCDQLVLLHKGAVLAEGEPEQVLADDNLAAAYGIRAVRWQADGQEFIVPAEKL
ncbi:ABC transporter ATP-binding protein [Emcibacter nanhaiensis]|uniref:ABC transporter ATP-binding protein n=1 Tax=Emcibacter nanhaiensis TaxID=1505037 RepID=A0A501PCE8_9PROT|nr:ABC transporter ATP-binding protein [Emcibacter nanhaiensis]TPD57895.1 ABC transporter ATP-binding protein [Emcibacter nanhaiensis]